MATSVTYITGPTKAIIYEMVARAIMTGIQPAAMLGTYHQNMERFDQENGDIDGLLTVANALAADTENPADVLLRHIEFGDAGERTFVEAAAHMNDENDAAIMIAAAAEHLRGMAKAATEKPRLI